MGFYNYSLMVSSFDLVQTSRFDFHKASVIFFFLYIYFQYQWYLDIIHMKRTIEFLKTIPKKKKEETFS